MTVAIAHDYLTQRGGAERVVLMMTRAFPEAPIYTSLYEPELSFPEFEGADIHVPALNRIGVLRRHHRLAFPLLAPVLSHMRIDADVVLCSSSGWAHGVETPGRKVVYCFAPARWLYQRARYVRHLGLAARLATRALGGPLRRWDQRHMRGASRYLTSSRYMADAIRAAYGCDAEVVPPPPAIGPDGASEPVAGIDPGFILCVARLLPYKNVDAIVQAFARLPREQLVIVGTGPEEHLLSADATANVHFAGAISDEQLRWLYANAAGLVAASHEDYGLTPLEAASFGKATAALRFGGFLDTLVEGRTGVFFDEPEPRAIAAGVEALLAERWDPVALRQHANLYSEDGFVARLRQIVGEAAA